MFQKLMILKLQKTNRYFAVNIRFLSKCKLQKPLKNICETTLNYL